MSDPPVPPTLCCVLLAAGASARLGRSKAFLQYDGVALLVRAVRSAAAVCESGVLVVAGPELGRVRELLAGEPARVVHNPAWHAGMSESVRLGVRAAVNGPDAILLWVVDQPLVSVDDLRALVAAWRATPDRPAAAGYAGGLGVPAIFPRPWWPRLEALRGDTGARALLRGAAAVTQVPMPNAAVDVDTPADAARLGLTAG